MFIAAAQLQRPADKVAGWCRSEDQSLRGHALTRPRYPRQSRSFRPSQSSQAPSPQCSSTRPACCPDSDSRCDPLRRGRDTCHTKPSHGIKITRNLSSSGRARSSADEIASRTSVTSENITVGPQHEPAGPTHSPPREFAVTTGESIAAAALQAHHKIRRRPSHALPPIQLFQPLLRQLHNRRHNLAKAVVLLILHAHNIRSRERESAMHSRAAIATGAAASRIPGSPPSARRPGSDSG